MNLPGRIQIHEGVAYFTHGSPAWSAPEYITQWWKIGDAEDFALQGEERAEYDGTCKVYRIHRGIHGTREITSNDGEADRVTIEPIPEPRTRLKTRWRYGRWERYTANGWKP